MTAVVAVGSAKGSPGVTFVTAAIALRFAAWGVPVLAIDADAEDRALASMLDVPSPPPAEAAHSLGVLTPEGLERAAFSPCPNLALVDGAGFERREVDGREVVGIARSGRFGVVVIDLGHAPGRFQRQVAAAADWILWVATGDRLSVERTDRLLAAPAAPGTTAALVFNRLGRAGLRDADTVLARRHSLPIVARIPDDPAAAAAVSAVRPPHDRRAFARPVAELCRTLDVAAAPAVRGTWP